MAAFFTRVLVAFAALVLSVSAFSAFAAVQDRELIVDLSNHEVSIAVDFAGAKLLLFGATEGVGDVIVQVRGPLRAEVVRRKERIAGVWMNRREIVFDRVPAFYAIASSKPLDQILSAESLAEEQVGVENLLMVPEDDASADAVTQFRAALIRNKQAMSLFPSEASEVRFLGNRLFRTDIRFPSNAAIGPYQVNVLLVKNGRITGSTQTPLILSRVGFEAEVYRLAHEHSLAYGVLAVVIAVVAGWLASVFFRSKA
jgi:uncharacterized protein (TIGR02186 family)